MKKKLRIVRICLKGGENMKKIISTVLIAAVFTSLAGVSSFASMRPTLNAECMKEPIEQMIQNGYWTNGKESICGCDTCQIILSDYDHLDEVLGEENARVFSKDMVENLIKNIDRENWKKRDFLLMSYDRKDGANYMSFYKKDPGVNSEDPNHDQQYKYKKIFENFVDTIKAISDINTSNEQAIQIRQERLIEGMNQCDVETDQCFKNAGKAKKVVIIGGVIASLLPIFKGLKKSWNTPVPESMENRYIGKSRTINWKDEIKFVGKVWSPLAGAIALPVVIMLGANKLGDYLQNKIISQHTCPVYIDGFPSYN